MLVVCVGCPPLSPPNEQVVDENLDTDEDGLTDVREAELGTDPNTADTDEDGYSDGDEAELDWEELVAAHKNFVSR